MADSPAPPPVHQEGGRRKEVDPTMATVPEPAAPPRWVTTRVAHPVRDLARSQAFYRDLLGLRSRGGFTGHDGYDGAFFALPGGGELELTTGPAEPRRAPTKTCWCCTCAPLKRCAGPRRIWSGPAYRPCTQPIRTGPGGDGPSWTPTATRS